jgi:hypothetical protein
MARFIYDSDIAEKISEVLETEEVETPIGIGTMLTIVSANISDRELYLALCREIFDKVNGDSDFSVVH